MTETEPGSPAMTARRLLFAASEVALATREEDGFPFVSLARMAADADGSPILLLSDLARHSRNLAGDPRASLLVRGQRGEGDALAEPRLTVLGRVLKRDDPVLRQRYLDRHPDVTSYAAFGDFSFYRMEVQSAYQVAGFGRIDLIAAGELLRGR